MGTFYGNIRHATFEASLEHPTQVALKGLELRQLMAEARIIFSVCLA